MNDTQASAIYEEIGRVLWSIMDEDTVKVFYQGFIYEGVSEFTYFWYDKKGNKKAIAEFNSPKDYVLDKVFELIESLQKVEPFSMQEPFTHFNLTLTEEGKFGAEFAYIPEEEYWPSLYMKGLRDLTEQEADEIGALEEWRRLAKKGSKNK